MVTYTHTPNIRRIYSRPWRDGGLANPGKIPTCIQVAVRPETTVRALETMFRTPPKLSTIRARLPGRGRIHVLYRDTHLDGGLARFVVEVFHTPLLLAGDLPELLFRALAAVGLETAAQGKVTVAQFAQFLAAEYLAQAMGDEVVFSEQPTSHSALRASAIPPLTEVRGFLAESL